MAFKTTLIFLTITLAMQFASAQYPAIDKEAPPIKADEWIQNSIKHNELIGKVVVLDFWFIQCAPCVASIPHLNKLADTYEKDDVVFISLTFDKKKDVEKFLTKMIMTSSVGIDTLRKTIKSYRVTGFPHVFVIDKNGILKWNGSPFNLNETILNPIIRNKPYIQIKRIDPESGVQNSFYNLSVNFNNTGNPPSRHSYSHSGESEILYYNDRIETIIADLLKISETRIDTIGQSFDNPMDIVLKVDDKYSTAGNNRKVLLYILEKQLQIDINKTKREVEVWNVSVENDSLLQQYISKKKYSGTSSNNREWQGTNITVNKLITVLENEFSILFYNDTQLKEKYDFKIPIKNFEEAREYLENIYGFKLAKALKEIEFIVIDFSKSDFDENNKN